VPPKGLIREFPSQPLPPEMRDFLSSLALALTTDQSTDAKPALASYSDEQLADCMSDMLEGSGIKRDHAEYLFAAVERADTTVFLRSCPTTLLEPLRALTQIDQTGCCLDVCRRVGGSFRLAVLRPTPPHLVVVPVSEVRAHARRRAFT
jgi:hypothetical protein